MKQPTPSPNGLMNGKNLAIFANDSKIPMQDI